MKNDNLLLLQVASRKRGSAQSGSKKAQRSSASISASNFKAFRYVFIVKSLACSASYDAIEQSLHDALEDLNLWLD